MRGLKGPGETPSAMLEARALQITSQGLALAITDPTSGQPLGVARWRTPRRHLFARPVLEVHEADDEPLVSTVHRHWLFRRTWHVRDADGERVGSIRGTCLRGRFGQLLARCQPSPEGGVSFQSHERRELATLIGAAKEVQMTFAAEVQGDPFVKMVLLAAALLHTCPER
jgi:hypothetical protein